MMTFSRLAVCLCGGLVLTMAQGIAQAQMPTIDPVAPTDSVAFVKAYSPDGQAGTFLFENLWIDTEIGNGGLPSAVTKRFVYVHQFKGTEAVRLTQTIRGFVHTQGSGSASLLIHSGGESTLVDLKAAIQTAGASTTVRPASFEAAKTLAGGQHFQVKSPVDGSQNFQVSFDRNVAVGKPLQTTLVMLVDRLPSTDEKGDGALLVVDSIDFILAKPDKPKK